MIAAVCRPITLWNRRARSGARFTEDVRPRNANLSWSQKPSRIRPRFIQSLVSEFDLPTAFKEAAFPPLGLQCRRSHHGRKISRSSTNQVVSMDQPSISRHSQKGLGMDQSSNDVSTPVAGQFALPLRATFALGDRVRKKSGASWQGQVVGWYCTKLTPEGYAVESESHPGSVQIYPVAALERLA